MKSNQIPHKLTTRRSKENPPKTKIIAKSLNSAFSAASEDDPIDSLLESSISDGSPEKNTPEEISKPSLLQSSDQIDPLDSLSEAETGHCVLDPGGASQIYDGSEVLTAESLELQVAVDLLLRARDQVEKSADVDLRSKRIVGDVIRRVIEPLDLTAAAEDEEERDVFFYGRLREKVYIGLVSFLVCAVSVSVVALRDFGTGMEFSDTLRPT